MCVCVCALRVTAAPRLTDVVFSMVYIHCNQKQKQPKRIDAGSGDAPIPTHDTLGGRVLRAAIGLFDGFGSALTGTSGPVILLPILIALRWEILDALGSAQAVQTPIAGAATIAYVTLRSVVVHSHDSLFLIWIHAALLLVIPTDPSTHSFRLYDAVSLDRTNTTTAVRGLSTLCLGRVSLARTVSLTARPLDPL
jgi:hypothetical protein